MGCYQAVSLLRALQLSASLVGRCCLEQPPGPSTIGSVGLASGLLGRNCEDDFLERCINNTCDIYSTHTK